MQSDITITGAGVGSLIAAHYLKKHGYKVALDETDTLPYSEITVYLKGTLFGAIAVTGESDKDNHTLSGFESTLNLPDYFGHLTAPPDRRWFFPTRPLSIQRHAQRHLSTPEVQKIIQFPFVLLGIDPRKTTAFPDVSVRATHASSQMIAIRISLKQSYRKLMPHTVIVSKDWDTHLKRLFSGRQWPGDPTIYVGALGKQDVLIEVPVPKNIPYTDTELKSYADWIISSVADTLHLKDFQKRIVTQEVIGPKLTNR